MTTKPFVLVGKQLQINAKCAEMRVEVLDAKGRAIPGFGLDDGRLHRQVDELRFTPRWNKKLSSLIGKTIRLRFHFVRGDLYSFHFPATRRPDAVR